MDDDLKLVTLTSMGFDLDVARSALVACNGDVERAIEYCLGGGGGIPAPDATAASAAGGGGTGTLIRASDVSQYTFGSDGRSACTCIALRYAERFLQATSQSAHVSATTAIIDDTFLSEGLNQGVDLYKAIKAGGSTSVEHMSAEEVLSSVHGKQAFACLNLDAPVRQGVLSSDSSSPLGMQAVLAGCQSDSHWVAVVITKSPETVVVALPPSSPHSASQYALLDSHPRPHLGADGSYAMAHDNMGSLVRTLYEIFPFTDLGNDVGEMMQMMYNSFDAYVLHI